MNNFEKLKSMSVEELAEWLDKYLSFEEALHMVWFADKYCNNCESIMVHYKDSTYEIPASHCELNHKCQYFPEMSEVPSGKEIAKMWLKMEVKYEEI